jgi:hypothetical protein
MVREEIGEAPRSLETSRDELMQSAVLLSGRQEAAAEERLPEMLDAAGTPSRHAAGRRPGWLPPPSSAPLGRPRPRALLQLATAPRSRATAPLRRHGSKEKVQRFVRRGAARRRGSRLAFRRLSECPTSGALKREPVEGHTDWSAVLCDLAAYARLVGAVLRSAISDLRQFQLRYRDSMTVHHLKNGNSSSYRGWVSGASPKRTVDF